MSRKNHQWDSNRSRSHCKLCTCERDKSGLTVKYRLNGKTFENAPPCSGELAKPKPKTSKLGTGYCPQCDKTFKHYESYYKHMMKKHFSDEQHS